MLNENRAAISAAGKDEVNQLFTKDMTAWGHKIIDKQFNSLDGPEIINYGVNDIQYKEFSINGDKGQVSGEISMYFVEKILRDGHYFHDRMDGKGYFFMTFAKEEGKWKISSFDASPLGAEHTLTPEG